MTRLLFIVICIAQLRMSDVVKVFCGPKMHFFSPLKTEHDKHSIPPHQLELLKKKKAVSRMPSPNMGCAWEQRLQVMRLTIFPTVSYSIINNFEQVGAWYPRAIYVINNPGWIDSSEQIFTSNPLSAAARRAAAYVWWYLNISFSSTLVSFT